MKKIIIISILLLFTSLNAMRTSSEFVQSNLKILNDLDLSSSYISNYDFQEFYKNYKKKYTWSYREKLKKADLFIPTIKKILKNNNMPSTFLYLAMAESNFELNARSHKKAIGIWQFMPRTAQMYGLKINYYTDERMDIEKSTRAAVIYLKKLYKMFDKWYLAALAYNCGEARVIEAITRATIDMYCEDNQNCKNDNTIKSYRKIIKNYQEKNTGFNKVYKVYKKVQKWNYNPSINELLIVQDKLERQYLPKESRSYMRKIVTLAMIGRNNNSLINNYIQDEVISTPLRAVKVKGGILLRNIADVIGLNKKQLKALNPHIKKNIIPPEEKLYDIYIPYALLSKFNNNIKNIKSNVFEVHIVKKGDTLGRIARIYGTKYTIIKKYNNLKSNILSINQDLIIPVDPDTFKKPKKYIVKKGDSLDRIARKFGIKYSIIKKYNNLKSNTLSINQKLMIPMDNFYKKNMNYLAKKNISVKQKYKKYIVNKGDTLDYIARKFNTKYWLIKKHNNLKSNTLSINQKLNIPLNTHINTSKKTTYKQYTVKKGDTLDKIAKKFGTNYESIKKSNKLKSNTLSINQNLRIKIDPNTYKSPKSYLVKEGDTLGEIARSFNVPMKRVMKDNYLKTSMINIGDKIVINFQ